MSDELAKEALHEGEQRMKGAIAALEEHLNGIRTGRASPVLVENLMVEYYGTPTPLLQLATIAAPEPALITIKPFDPSTVSNIEKAIRVSDLGLTPSNDGKIIRLPLPALTEERRKELVKIMHKYLEEARVAVRNIRRDVRDDLRDMEKEKMIGEDAYHGYEDNLEKLTAHYVEQIEKLGDRKEKEIMEV